VSHGAVNLNVRGQRFEVLPELILGKPETLLAQLLCDIGTDASKPIFVDANARRFEHILDWYRYGRMFVEEGPRLEAVLHDAMFFLLPDTVVINGRARTTGSAHVGEMTADTAKGISKSYVDGVVGDWPDFDALFADVVHGVRGKVTELVRRSSVKSPCSVSDEISVVPVDLASLDAALQNRCCEQVISVHRQRAFVHKLREAGFRVHDFAALNFGSSGALLHLCVGVPIGTSVEPAAVQAVCPFTGLPVCAGGSGCRHFGCRRRC